MIRNFFDFFAILVNHLFNHQLVERLAFRVEFKCLLRRYNCINDVVNVILIEFISRICNEKNMSVWQISFLKFDYVDVRVYYSHDMTFNKIAQKLSEFQLKHLSHQVETIHDINDFREISLEFFSVWIADENDKKDEFIELSNQSESVLLFDFHVSREFHMIWRQYRYLLINIIELIILIQSIYQISIEISSQKLLIKTNEIEIIKFHADKRIHQEMLKQSSRMQHTTEFLLATLYIYITSKRNEILTLIHWSSAIKKQQIHRISLATIDRFVRRMRDLHRDEDFNNALNRVRNTLLRFRARIKAHRHWRFHDLTNEELYYKKMIFAFLFRSKYAENKAVDRVYAEKKLVEIENVLRCEKCRKRRIWMMYE